MSENHTKKILLIFHIYLAIFFVIFINFLVFKFYNPELKSNLSEIRKYVAHIAFGDREVVIIESKERLAYFLNVIFIASLIFLSYFFIKKNEAKITFKEPKIIYKNLKIVSWSLFLLFLIFTVIIKIWYFMIYMPDYAASQKVELYSSLWLAVFALLLFSLILLKKSRTSKALCPESSFDKLGVASSKIERASKVILSLSNDDSGHRALDVLRKQKNNVILAISSILLSLLVASYALFNQNRLDYFALNFSAVFNPAIETFLGKAPLINQKTLYGLNSYFFAFLLKIFNGNFLAIVYANALLLLVALLSIAFAFFKIIENKFLAFLSFSSFVFIQFFAEDNWPNPQGISFQYEPIRLLFPALLIGFFANYFQDPSRKKYYFSLIFFSLAFWWNSDSGAPTFVVLALFLGYERFFISKKKSELSFRNIAKYFLEIFAIFISISAIIILALYAKYKAWPDFSLMFYGQITALNFGYAVLNSTVFGIWHFPVLIYLIGLVLSIKNFLEKKHDFFLIFFTILGIGLFSYYVGRSHDNNVLHCAYPTIFILAILAEKYKVKLPLFIICYLASALLFSLISLQSLRDNFFTKNFIKDDSDIVKFTEFSKEIVGETKGIRDDILIISQNDQDYYLALKLKAQSPFNFVNFRHAFFEKEITELHNLIVARQKKYVILIRNKSSYLMPAFSKEEMEKITKLLRKNYKFCAKKTEINSEVEVFVLK